MSYSRSYPVYASGAEFTEVNVKYTFIMALKNYIRYQLLIDLAWLLLRLLYAMLDIIRSLFEW